jgi:hypothetical protein
VRAVRRAALAVGFGVLGAILLRLTGASGTAPEQGGWRELRGDDLR